MKLHAEIWQFLKALTRRARIWAGLSAVSTVATFVPNLSRFGLKYVLIAIAVFCFVAANFLVFRDQRAIIRQFVAEKDALLITVEHASFRTAAQTDQRTGLCITLLLHIRNTRTESTTLTIREADLEGVSLEETLTGHFQSSGSVHNVARSVDIAAASSVTLRTSLIFRSQAVISPDSVPPSLNGSLVLEETRFGRMPVIDFVAARDGG